MAWAGALLELSGCAQHTARARVRGQEGGPSGPSRLDAVRHKHRLAAGQQRRTVGVRAR